MAFIPWRRRTGACVGAVGDSAVRADEQREPLVDSGDQRCPQVGRRGARFGLGLRLRLGRYANARHTWRGFARWIATRSSSTGRITADAADTARRGRRVPAGATGKAGGGDRRYRPAGGVHRAGGRQAAEASSSAAPWPGGCRVKGQPGQRSEALRGPPRHAGGEQSPDAPLWQRMPEIKRSCTST